MPAPFTNSGYKALVCIFLYGGNQSYNWIVPTTTAKYNEYATARGGLAISQGSLLDLTGTATDGYAYGLHPSCPNLQSLFNGGKAAILSGCGTLVQPTTPTTYANGSAQLPPQLFSHVNQQQEWMTSYVQNPATNGWGGRISDTYISNGVTANLSFTMVMSAGQIQYFTVGALNGGYAVGNGGAPTFDALSNTGYRSGTRTSAFQSLYSAGAADSNLLIQAISGIQTSAVNKQALLNTALTTVGDFPSGTFSITDQLQVQLHTVAWMIKAHSQIGDARQIFFVEMGGFDTHDGELATQSSLLSQLDTAINIFQTAIESIGMDGDVVTFTNSDFSRTLAPNSDGDDHAWSGHHMIIGTPVTPGYYGTPPSLVIGGADDVGQGRLCPTTATDVYAATLAEWFGINSSYLTTLFPNLGNFSPQTLGFL